MQIFESFNEKPVNRHIVLDSSDKDLLEEYEQLLQRFYPAAGSAIQSFLKSNNMFSDNSWIQTSLIHPAFQHLCFQFKGNEYSVIIEFAKNNSSLITRQILDNQIRECEKYNLIPCTITLDKYTGQPIYPDSHLVHTQTREPIVVCGNDKKVPMSEWDLNDMGINIVLQDLRKEGCTIKGYSNVPHIEPQIWFENKAGKPCYVVVNTISANTRENIGYKVNPQLILKLHQFDGFFAEVGISSAEAVAYDEEGQLAPLSKRFDMADPQGIINRGDGCYINYKGLQTIERTAANSGTKDKDLYTIG